MRLPHWKMLTQEEFLISVLSHSHLSYTDGQCLIYGAVAEL